MARAGSRRSATARTGAGDAGVNGLGAMLWFSLGLALLLRPYDGNLPWRSAFLAGAGVVSVVSGQIASWDAAAYRSSDIDPQVARYAFDLGNLSFANGWVATGAVGICAGMIMIGSPELPHGSDGGRGLPAPDRYSPARCGPTTWRSCRSRCSGSRPVCCASCCSPGASTRRPACSDPSSPWSQKWCRDVVLIPRQDASHRGPSGPPGGAEPPGHAAPSSQDGM
jgi:hypothetical protein